MLSTTSITTSPQPADAPRLHEIPCALERRPLRVAIIDEHLLFRQGLRAILAREPDMTVVADGADASALALVDLALDVAIVDVGLRQKCGAGAAREVLRRCPTCHVLALAGVADESLAARVFAAGASGYALRDQDAAEVLAAIRAVADGQHYLAPGLPANLRGGTCLSRSGSIEDLTPREHEIFRLAVQGRSNRDIADRLRISIKTVEAHRAGINRKLSAHSTADLVRIAARRGLLVM